jgi:hypothetical protein
MVSTSKIPKNNIISEIVTEFSIALLEDTSS